MNELENGKNYNYNINDAVAALFIAFNAARKVVVFPLAILAVRIENRFDVWRALSVLILGINAVNENEELDDQEKLRRGRRRGKTRRGRYARYKAVQATRASKTIPRAPPSLPKTTPQALLSETRPDDPARGLQTCTCTCTWTWTWTWTWALTCALASRLIAVITPYTERPGTDTVLPLGAWLIAPSILNSLLLTCPRDPIVPSQGSQPQAHDRLEWTLEEHREGGPQGAACEAWGHMHMRIADPEGANPPLFGMSALCRTRKVEGACSQQAWPPSSFLGSFLAKRPRKQLVMVGNPGPRHGKHIAFICHFHHPWANLSKKNGTSSWMHLYFVPSSWRSAQKHTQKINPAVALSHEALSGTSRSHCLTLPPRHRLSSSTQLSNVRNQIDDGTCRKQPQRTYAVYDPTGSNARQINWRNKPSPPTIAVAVRLCIRILAAQLDEWIISSPDKDVVALRKYSSSPQLQLDKPASLSPCQLTARFSLLVFVDDSGPHTVGSDCLGTIKEPCIGKPIPAPTNHGLAFGSFAQFRHCEAINRLSSAFPESVDDVISTRQPGQLVSFVFIDSSLSLSSPLAVVVVTSHLNSLKWEWDNIWHQLQKPVSNHSLLISAVLGTVLQPPCATTIDIKRSYEIRLDGSRVAGDGGYCNPSYPYCLLDFRYRYALKEVENRFATNPSCARTEYMSMSSEIWRILDRLMHSYPEREKPTFSSRWLMRNISSAYQRLMYTKLRYRIPPEMRDAVAQSAPATSPTWVGFFCQMPFILQASARTNEWGIEKFRLLVGLWLISSPGVMPLATHTTYEVFVLRTDIPTGHEHLPAGPCHLLRLISAMTLLGPGLYDLSVFTRGAGRGPSLKDPNPKAFYEESHVTSPAGCCTKDPPPHRLESASPNWWSNSRHWKITPTKPRTLEFVILNITEALVRNIKEICHGACFQNERFLAGVRSMPAERRDFDQNNANSPTRLIRLICTCVTKTRYLTMHSRLDVGLVIDPTFKASRDGTAVVLTRDIGQKQGGRLILSRHGTINRISLSSRFFLMQAFAPFPSGKLEAQHDSCCIANTTDYRQHLVGGGSKPALDVDCAEMATAMAQPLSPAQDAQEEGLGSTLLLIITIQGGGGKRLSLFPSPFPTPSQLMDIPWKALRAVFKMVKEQQNSASLPLSTWSLQVPLHLHSQRGTRLFLCLSLGSIRLLGMNYHHLSSHELSSQVMLQSEEGSRLIIVVCLGQSKLSTVTRNGNQG
ncbi:uncharacterized protein CLUP02_06128 [Colletotrichum lupini]|uniref:Uncharacterized protein n=1 Tax=Colletotrichum lupini TaxID=145971 RepID=A0A9Q8SNH8_9PEZI|nr:uncharacterized protein CLUP02_06128 [Colletotrichum lupini]UQC80644.1 hypothetical protein CLUP02_06128 [Colletotrichum lupini]